MVLLSGCTERNAMKTTLYGKWRSEPVQTEWGRANYIFLFVDKGTVVLTVTFLDETPVYVETFSGHYKEGDSKVLIYFDGVNPENFFSGEMKNECLILESNLEKELSLILKRDEP